MHLNNNIIASNIFYIILSRFTETLTVLILLIMSLLIILDNAVYYLKEKIRKNNSKTLEFV